MWYVAGRKRLKPYNLTVWRELNKRDQDYIRRVIGPPINFVTIGPDGFEYNMERIEQYAGKEFVAKHFD
jgi:hypothetical protein